VNIGVSKESEKTRNADENHDGTSDTYFHVYNKGTAIYGKYNLEDIDVNVIT
jgi:hypothetical protein